MLKILTFQVVGTEQYKKKHLEASKKSFFTFTPIATSFSKSEGYDKFPWLWLKKESEADESF